METAIADAEVNKSSSETDSNGTELLHSEENINQDSSELNQSEEPLGLSKEVVNVSNEKLSDKNDSTIVTENQSDKSLESDGKDTEIKTTIPEEEYAKYITYKEDGTAVYVDPKTNLKYNYSEETKTWEQITDETSKENPYENEHYRWCFKTSKWIPKTQPNVEYSVEDGCHTYKDNDGTVFFYDQLKKAWFPKIDDDFMAIYQLNYGFDKDGNHKRKVVDDEGFKIPMSIKEDLAEKTLTKNKIEQEGAESELLKTAEQNKKRKVQEPPSWFDITPEQNTKVYVSNLPRDITETEFTELMSKCGLIMKDQKTNKFKIKLYLDSNGELKGDGLCDYIKVESVDLALNILDGYDVRGKEIKVQRAKFEMRGEYNPALKPKKRKKDKEKVEKLKQKLLDWRPDKMRGERGKHERVVIIKNLFDPEMFEQKVELILEYQTDLREECTKCGNVRKVTIYDRHVDGVASISMASPEEADSVVQMMNRRFYGKRRLVAEIWDGKANYKVDETLHEEQSRLSKWDKFLETEEQVNKNDIETEEKSESS